MRPKHSPTTIFFALVALGDAITLDCSNIRENNKRFDLSPLKGPHSVTEEHFEDPVWRNITWTIDICNPIPKAKENPGSQCPVGTNVCGIEKTWNPDEDPHHENPETTTDVIPVAGTIKDSGSRIDPKPTILEPSDDYPSGGLRLELHGGQTKKKPVRKQMAIVTFICDKDRSGNEGNQQKNDERKRTDDQEKDDQNSLKFKDYLPDADDENIDVLFLEWRTKYVCADHEQDSDAGEKKASWGFFTWFIVLAFMGTAAYLIFGSWLNYNRYGARGWDLLPHGDTIRDVPYIFKDFSRKVMDTVSGGGSRGGYSAV